MMDPRVQAIVDLAVRIGRMPVRDAEALWQQRDQPGFDLAIALRAGLLDDEEIQWLGAMVDRGVSQEEVAAWQHEWRLVRFAWAERRFPPGSELLPRMLLEAWARGELVTLAGLVRRSGFDPRFLVEIEQDYADGRLRIDQYSLKVERIDELPDLPGAGTDARLEAIRLGPDARTETELSVPSMSFEGSESPTIDLPAGASADASSSLEIELNGPIPVDGSLPADATPTVELFGGAVSSAAPEPAGTTGGGAACTTSCRCRGI